MNVSEKMKINPVTCSPEINIYDAQDLMEREGVHHLPVLENGHLVGIISDKDLMKATPNSSSSLSIHKMAYMLSKLVVRDVMTTELVTTNANAAVEEACRIMVDNEISCLPVVDGDKLLGIITKTDMYRILLDLFGARHYGIKADFYVQDKPGVIAEITSRLAKEGADIISIGTLKCSNGEGSVTIKVQGISKDLLSDILSDMAVRIVDIREI